MRAFWGHSTCHGGICGASGCKSETEIKACCVAVTSCTAYYGGYTSDWWTFHAECVLETHTHSYRTCMKPPSSPPADASGMRAKPAAPSASSLLPWANVQRDPRAHRP